VATRKQAPAPVTTSGHKAELIRTMRGLQHRHDLWRVFSDFVEMAAVAIANATTTCWRMASAGVVLTAK
jgi:hypothetical protein